MWCVVAMPAQRQSFWDVETDVADEPWARDEEMFLDHFGVPYEEFAVRLPMLSADQHKRYADTLVVNPEAAVLWVISMGAV